jgi:GNAT superfamily N-acetyltransferase
MAFPLIDQYTGVRLGLDLGAVAASDLLVVESERRCRPEQSYGYVHGLWCVRLARGGMAVSVPPGAGHEVEAILAPFGAGQLDDDEAVAEALRGPVEEALAAAGMPPTNRVIRDLVFACNASGLERHPVAGCRRLADESVPAAEGLDLPTHCFPDGTVYGVVAAGEVVSMAHAHRAGVMEGCVCDVGVATAPGHRRQGYARAVVSALVGEFVDRGGEARYSCSPGNVASQATARSVGFAAYGTSLILAVPRPD